MRTSRSSAGTSTHTPAPADPPAALVAPGGASAALERDGDVAVLRVRDERGCLVFEHRPAEGRSVVYAPHGDLQFRAEHGAIELHAAGPVRVHSGEAVELRGDAALRLTSPLLDARAERAHVAVGEGRLLARSVHTAVETAHHLAGVIEVEAGRLVERLKNAYRDVEDLAQTRAGRVRLLARDTFHLLGRRTLLKAEQDLKLDGDKIHLG